TSIWPLQADQLVVSFLTTSYYGTYVSGTYIANRQRSGVWGDAIPAPARQGWFNWFAVLPWPFMRGVYLPGTDVVLRYHATRIYAKDGNPLTVDGTIVFRLGHDLRYFVETFNVLGKGSNLAADKEISYIWDRQPETGEVKTHTYRSCGLAQVVLDDTETLVWETIRRVAEKMSFEDIRGDTAAFEKKVILLLAEPESAFVSSGMLRRSTDAAGNPIGIASPAIRDNGIDFNFEDVTPMNKEFFDSLSRPATGLNEGLGEGNRIARIAKMAKVSGEEVIRNDSLRKAGDLTIIAAGDTLSAVVGGLLKKQPGRNPGRGQQQNNP
ncbi:MAG: hypothetical protein ACREQV_05275, partial [Candidatus Binatia bacterium]